MWTLPLNSSRTMSQSGTIVRLEAVMDLSPSSTTLSPTRCLMMTYFLTMTSGSPCCWEWPRGTALTFDNVCPLGVALPPELRPRLWRSPGRPRRSDGALWLQRPSSLLVLQDERWQCSGQRGSAWKGDQQNLRRFPGNLRRFPTDLCSYTLKSIF